jgi:hypothetical protein
MKLLATHHFLRDVTGIGVAAGVLFSVGLAVESGPAVAVGLIGVLFVAVLVPFIVAYFEEQASGREHRRS